MSDLDALLAGIVADPQNALRWLVMADWLEENGQPERAELVRVHRELLRTCTEPDAFPERAELHVRMMELMRAGVQPCLPRGRLTLPGGVILRMSFIPPGSFLMGSPEAEASRFGESRQRVRDVPCGFWLGVAPVTQRQWLSLIGENPSLNQDLDCPVERVSWNDARRFCDLVRQHTGRRVRLPASVEWEYACRAGTVTPFYWGNELDGSQANCDGSVPYGTGIPGPNLGRTSPVGQYERVSPHPWSLVDMIGNVLEWGADGDRSRRVRRGGSYLGVAADCRTAVYLGNPPDDRVVHLGFRVAADVAGT